VEEPFHNKKTEDRESQPAETAHVKIQPVQLPVKIQVCSVSLGCDPADYSGCGVVNKHADHRKCLKYGIAQSVFFPESVETRKQLLYAAKNQNVHKKPPGMYINLPLSVYMQGGFIAMRENPDK
jgi:hypothetical protein